MITVKDIVEDWLRTKEYTGLYCEECGCEIDDLMPCAGMDNGYDRCKPGYKIHCDTNCSECDKNKWCDMDPEFSDWYITGEK